MELVLATRNEGKVREIRECLADLPIDIESLANFPKIPSCVEDGLTFEANALKKAHQTADFLGRWALADDSGLEVRILNGQPGVYSARYAGEQADDAANNAKLLNELKNTPPGNRQARFVCVLALVSPSHEDWLVRGICEGEIAMNVRGRNGFGYDPLFFIPQLGKTFGELDATTKKQWSHRGKALRELRSELQKKIPLFRKN